MILTLSKIDLQKILLMVLYAPHPEVRIGQFNFAVGTLNLDGRETTLCISPTARIDLTGDIIIGPWCMIGPGTKIYTHDHHHEGREPLLLLQERIGVKWSNLFIGKDVWLHGCTILNQVTEIPDGVVVGSGAILTKNPGAYEIWAGCPAVKIGER